MGTSIIDGKVTATEVRRKAGDMTIFKSIEFLRDDGSLQSLKNAVTKGEVTDALQPGATGRFYCYTALDIRGIHAVRTHDGRALYDYSGGNNQKIFLIAGIVGAALTAFMLVTRDGISLLGAATLILGVVGYIFMGKGARETKEQFERDAAYRAPPLA